MGWFRRWIRATKKQGQKTKPKEENILFELMDLEFCPGMAWLFDVLYQQRKELQRLCSRYSAIRVRCKPSYRHIIMEAFEEVDMVLEHNIGEILKLCVRAGWDPRYGFYQPQFKKSAINRTELRTLLAENADCLEKLGTLLTLAHDKFDVSAEVTIANLDATISLLSGERSFEEDFAPGMSFGVRVA